MSLYLVNDKGRLLLKLLRSIDIFNGTNEVLYLPTASVELAASSSPSNFLLILLFTLFLSKLNLSLFFLFSNFNFEVSFLHSHEQKITAQIVKQNTQTRKLHMFYLKVLLIN